MRLLLDIGNTRIKWAVQTDQGLNEQQAMAHAGLNAAQLGTQIFAPSGQISQLLVSNVAGELMAEQVRQAARDCWQIEPLFVVSSASTTVSNRMLHNAYSEPANLGVDRWLAMLGAYAMSPIAALVVSVGTAMTLDAFAPQHANNESRHLGGMIVPGPDMMMQSLMRNTSDIAVRAQQGEYGHENDERFFADNTLGCVYQGAIHATTALIETAYAHLLHSHQDARLLLTGGAAAQVERRLSMSVQVVPDLVLRGLAALY
jgi:type III pantothenate kinase